MVAQTKVFIGAFAHCMGPFSVEFVENGFVVVQDSKISAVGDQNNINEVLDRLEINSYEEIRLKKNQLLIPGLIDTHIHAPQYPNIGLGYDLPLMKWLDKYTFKLESQYRDLDFSKKVFDSVVQKTLSFGTTTACYFGTLFKDSTLILVDSVIEYGQRALVGKVNMTQHAPENYMETPNDCIKETIDFIKTVRAKNSPLVDAIITPRFAISVNMSVMQELAKIAQQYDCAVQSHISENLDEIKFVNELFDDEYANVYRNANLLSNKCVLAHGVHLNDNELKTLAQFGSSIAHCPASNTRLKSGLCDVKRLIDNGINVGLGTDVSGGDSCSIIATMRAAVDVSIHLSFSKSYLPLTYLDTFYLATLGGAKALNLDQKIGNFIVNKEFDALIIDVDVPNSSADLLCEVDCYERLQKFVFCGDDRNVMQVYVAGKLVKGETAVHRKITR